MTEPHSRLEGRRSRSLLDRLAALLKPGPEDRIELLALLRAAGARRLLDADAVSMIEGVLQVSDLAARDVMVPRAQMDVLDIADTPDQFLPFVLETAHSRFPVIEGGRDNVIGILLAKDLLRYYVEPDLDIRGLLRPTVFIPESKRLNVLLRDFRANRNHIAIVVDEYGGVAGLITIEDVLEQIVGDIEDEYDFDETEDNVVPVPHDPGAYRVRGLTEIQQLNEVFGSNFHSDDVDTVAGLLSGHLGRVPHRGERIDLHPLTFEVLRSDGRQIDLVLIKRLPPPADDLPDISG